MDKKFNYTYQISWRGEHAQHTQTSNIVPHSLGAYLHCEGVLGVKKMAATRDRYR